MAKSIVTIPCSSFNQNNSGYDVKVRNTFNWTNNETWPLEFEFSKGMLSGGLEPWLVLVLLPAMQAGVDLELAGPVSSLLLQNLNQIQVIYNGWNPSYKKIEIKALPAQEPLRNKTGDRKTALFFSAGIDSYYTLLKYYDEIDTLIYMDNPYAHEVGRARLNGKIVEAATAFGKSLIIFKSNFRPFLDSYVSWDFSHGAALVAAAHFLTPMFSKVYLSANFTYSNLMPSGTHPLIDSLWGSDDLEVVDDGYEVNRIQKVAKVTQNEVVLRTLRICWRNIENELNCGRCRKCVGTMLSLRVVGKLDACTTFKVPLDLEYLSTLELPNLHSRQYFLENLIKAEEQGDDPALIAALRKCLIQQKPLPQMKLLTGTEPELLELREKNEYYRALRFQIADRLKAVLSKSPLVYNVSETLAHKLWKMLR